jgi:hypothetical protein
MTSKLAKSFLFTIYQYLSFFLYSFTKSIWWWRLLTDNVGNRRAGVQSGVRTFQSSRLPNVGAAPSAKAVAAGSLH